MLILIVAILIAALLTLILREEMKYRRLAEKEEERQAMLAIVAHQLRMPLTSVKWYAEMLMSEDFGKLKIAQMELLDKIDQGSARAVTLLNRFLDVSRMERAGIPAIPKAIDAREAVQRVLDSLAEHIGEKKHKINFKKGQKRLLVYIDPLLLHATLDAIIRNAIAYTHSSGKIDISFKEEGRNIVIVITDSGIGISEKEKSKIFKKFYRGKQGRLISPVGNGLGLYFVNNLIQESKGKIWFESEEGRGTTFFLSLPKAKK